jgi:hypothetical protein
MSAAWKKHDRPCGPCPDCKAELYEKFWGNGGWAKTDKATDKSHGPADCVRRLLTELATERARSSELADAMTFRDTDRIACALSAIDRARTGKP